MNEKAERDEHSVFEKLEDLKNQISIHAQEVDTMVTLGREVAIAEAEGNKLVKDWSLVFDIIGHIQKIAQEKIDKLEELLATQRFIERETQPITTGLKRLNDLS